ncbi:MAG: DUF4080 domain-containing protein [Ruminococcaceae bacterium]|nr:DUF4080 domain-containing protein [Oscillospiraceae bacterium]
MKTVLFSYNASHYHTNLAVRALRTSLSELKNTENETKVIEFSLKDKRAAVLSALYGENADIYAFSTYIWNIRETLDIARNLKKLRPSSKIVFGGPEASFRAEEITQELDFIDCVIVGEGEIGIKTAISSHPKLPKIINSPQDPEFENRPIHYVLPSGETEDLAPGKFVYYESSRGCPFSCGYCLSGNDCKVRAKSVEKTLADLADFEKLSGGKRTVKLVDRTFNYDLPRAKAVWRGLLSESYTNCYHFEIQPGILDEESFDILSSAPMGKFQLEAGIQSVNPAVLKECGRGGDIVRELENLKRLKSIENVPVHCDLICGLPTEDLGSIREGVNKAFYVCNELQIGFLKLLYGARITKDAEKYGMIYMTEPSYEVLSTDTLSFSELMSLRGIAKVCDRVVNSGRFTRALEYILGNEPGASPLRVTPFDFLLALSERLNGDPSAYSQAAMYEQVCLTAYGFCENEEQKNAVKAALLADFTANERTRIPRLLLR